MFWGGISILKKIKNEPQKSPPLLSVKVFWVCWSLQRPHRPSRPPPNKSMRRKSKKYEKKYEIEKKVWGKVWGFRKEKYEKNEKKYEIEEKVWEKVLDWKKSMR